MTVSVATFTLQALVQFRFFSRSNSNVTCSWPRCDLHVQMNNKTSHSERPLQRRRLQYHTWKWLKCDQKRLSSHQIIRSRSHGGKWIRFGPLGPAVWVSAAPTRSSTLLSLKRGSHWSLVTAVLLNSPGSDLQSDLHTSVLQPVATTPSQNNVPSTVSTISTHFNN